MKKLLINLYFADTLTTRYWSVWVMLLAALGLWLRQDDPTQDVALLLDLAPWWCWSGMLVVLAIYRILGIFEIGMTPFTKFMTPMCSMFIWAMFLAAALAAPYFGLSILFVVPAMQDTWLLSRAFLARQNP